MRSTSRSVLGPATRQAGSTWRKMTLPISAVAHWELSKAVVMGSILRIVAIIQVTTTLQHRPVNTQHRPVNIQHRSVNTQHRPVNIQHRPVNIQHRPVNILRHIIIHHGQNLLTRPPAIITSTHHQTRRPPLRSCGRAQGA